MRQEVTGKQWYEELTKEEQIKFSKERPPNFRSCGCGRFPTAMGMIEYLKDDLVDIEFHKYEQIVIIHIGEGETKGFTEEELVDALFEAVKYKLSTT